MLDHFERGKLLLTGVDILVIDEADRMLDMGFIPDIERIVTLLPPLRQTLFFSATMPPEIRRLADKFLSSPKEITVARPATTATNIEDFIVPVPGEIREELATIPGSVPNLIELPEACRFSPRCSARVEHGNVLAQRVHPELRPVDGEHLVRCWLYYHEDGSLRRDPDHWPEAASLATASRA